MGLLDFNITEIASRLVRGAAVRGRIRPTMDDGIVPVAQVMNYGQAPYRLDEQKYFGSVPLSTAAAGDWVALCVLNKSPRPIVMEYWRVTNRAATVPRIFITMATRTIIDALNQAGGDTAVTCYENGPSPWTIRNDIILRNGSVIGSAFPTAGNFIGTFDMISTATGGGQATSPPGFDLVITPGSGIVFSGTAATDRYSLEVQLRVINNIALP